ncbi:MAG: choice-of-anchor Q domain-containing protein, partial [Phycisphaerales bacterium]
ISTTAGGYVSYPGMGARPVYAGTTTVVRAEAAIGYRFTGWTGTAVDAGAVEDPAAADTRVTVDADYTLTANFVPEGTPTIQHTLTVSSGKGGCVVNPGEGAFQFNENAHVVIQAIAESGYRFTGWTGTAVSAGKVADPAYFSTTVLMTADFTLAASFERTSEVIHRYLTVTSTEGGRASAPGEGVFTYTDGLTVTLTAKADPGYRFSGWTGSAVDADKLVDPFSAETIVAMDGNYTVQANFIPASQDSSSLLILRPNGREKLASGSTTTIAWQALGAVSAFDLELSTDGGVTWTQITQCGGRSYSWKVPALSSDRCLIRVRISDNPAIFDDSDATFTIYAAVSRIWYVDAAAKGARNGTSWANAFIHLQDAIGKAISGDSILVAEGLYRPDLGGKCKEGDRAAAFQLADGIGIFGGFPAGGGGWSVRNPAVHKSILSGDLGASGATGDNSYHVVVANNVAKTAVLDGCVVCDGYADGEESCDRGAGLYNLSGSPQIRNCMFLRNYASNGAGAYNLKGSPLFVNCIFTANSAGKSGGGLYNQQGAAAVVNCTLTANQGLWRGGGVFNASGSLTIANSIFWDNGRQFKSSYDEWAQVSGDVQPAVAYCCIQGWTGSFGGDGSFGDDPLFVRATGPDAVAGTSDDDLRISNGSPCIDAGNALAVPSEIATDLEGKPRMLNHVDIGAYEFDAGK